MNYQAYVRYKCWWHSLCGACSHTEMVQRVNLWAAERALAGDSHYFPNGVAEVAVIHAAVSRPAVIGVAELGDAVVRDITLDASRAVLATAASTERWSTPRTLPRA